MRFFLLPMLIWAMLPFQVIAQYALNQEWFKPLGDSINSTAFFNLDGNGEKILMLGYIVRPDTAFGCVQCNSNGSALLLVTDSNGNKTYSKCYPGNGGDDFRIGHFGKYGSIWVVGYFTSTTGIFPDTTGKVVGVVKFDSAYNSLWYHFYGSTQENNIADFITTSDGGALILASTNYANGDIPYLYGNDPFNFDAYLCKLDSAGNIQWLKVLGGSGNQQPTKIRELEPNIYTVLIYTNSVDYMLAGINFDSVNASPWVLKIDSGGHILSSLIAHNLYGIEPVDFMPTKNGGGLFGGTYRPLSDSDFCYPGLGGYDFALVAMASDYNHLWCKTMGGANNDYFYYMSKINYSTVVSFGNSQSDNGSFVRCNADTTLGRHGWLSLVNIDNQELTWQASFCSEQEVTPEGMWYDSTSQSLYVMMTGGADGDFSSEAISGTINNTYLFKYNLISVTSIKEIAEINAGLGLFPNPANNECILKIDEPNLMCNAAIFDAIGRQVMSLFSNQQFSTFNINCNSLYPGLYFVRVIDTNGGVGIVKMVKE